MDRLPGAIDFSPDTLRTQLKGARRKLEELTDALQCVADWRDDLRVRIRHAQLRFQFVSLNQDEQTLLAAEVTTFVEVWATPSQCRFARQSDMSSAILVRSPSEPMPNARLFLQDEHGHGLLGVSSTGVVEVLVEPRPWKPRQNKKRRARLIDEHRKRIGDPAPGGSTRQPIMTAYRQQALACAASLAEGPRAPPSFGQWCQPLRVFSFATGMDGSRASSVAFMDLLPKASSLSPGGHLRHSP